MGLLTKHSTEEAELGRRYRDKISGFEGVCVSLTSYLYGCQHVGLSGMKKDGTPVVYDFDEPGVELVEGQEFEKVEKVTGGPAPSGYRAMKPGTE